MLRSWIKQFVRVSARGKFYTIVNILGLAFGLACTILILLWANYQSSFDEFHDDSSKILKLYEIQKYSNGYNLYTYSTPGPLAPFLRENYPEVTASVRFNNTSGVIGIGEKAFRDDMIGFTDSTFFDIFKVEFVSGSKDECLNDLRSIVLTEEFANKIFGNTYVVGESVRINGTLEFTISAIIKDYPKNSNIGFTCLVPFENMSDFGLSGLNEWGWNSHSTYIRINDLAMVNDLEVKFNQKYHELHPDSRTSFYYFPLERVRLYSPDPNSFSLIILVGLMVAIAGFVLLIASINFINLITARSANRAKEVGVRKVVGSSRKQLITQYFIESFLTTLASLAVAILIVDFVLPVFNQIIGMELQLSFNDFNLWIKILVVVLAVGFVSGIYPAFVLSSFQPASVLKGNMRSGAKNAGFRKAMVIIQFTLTIFMVVVTFYMFRQLKFISTKDIGMSRKNVFSIPFRNEMQSNYKSFISELRNVPGVSYATSVSDFPFRIGSSTSSIRWSGIDTTQSYLFTFTSSDEYLIETMGMEMAEGRFYSSQFPADTGCIVLNEEAAKIIGLSPIIGETITVWGQPKQVIGIIKNFNMSHISDKINPLFVWYGHDRARMVIVKSDSPFSETTMNGVSDVFEKFYPEYPFESTNFDDVYNRMYSAEKQTQTLFAYFAVLAIIISCIGLLSLAAFIAEQQRKSLVLRKIHGATVRQVLLILLGNFTKWVFISGLIALPLSYIFLRKLFADYVYHATFSWWIFAGALLASLFVAAVTVLYQAIKSSRVNPAEILRYE